MHAIQRRYDHRKMDWKCTSLDVMFYYALYMHVSGCIQLGAQGAQAPP